MSRPRVQTTCHNCGNAPAYAMDLCEPCYRYRRRTGTNRDPRARSRLMDRRYSRLVRELETAAVQRVARGLDTASSL